MTRLVILAALLASPAVAQVSPYGPRMVALPPDAECVARVAVHNLFGVYHATETVETERGPVSIRYETVGQHNARDHDRIVVVSLPDGLYARPMEAEIPDGAVLSVCVFEYLGG